MFNANDAKTFSRLTTIVLASIAALILGVGCVAGFVLALWMLR